jgi:tetratricopeptide (TPR) repeat protein
MPEEHKTVFISYRRSAAGFIARAIFLDLRANGYDVFMDVETMDSGQFERIIFNQVEARAHFLVILTPGTVERYANLDDLMRREIEYAMEKQRNIVPLLANNFSFTEAQPYLTGKLADLPRFNGVTIPLEYFDEAMSRLRSRFLKQPVYGAIKPAPASEQPTVQQKIDEVTAQPAPTEKQLDAEEYFNRAILKQRSDDHDRAIADYTEVIRLNPDYYLAYTFRGWSYAKRGDIDDAIADYTEAIRLYPHSYAYYNRGKAYFELGKFAQALEDFQRAYNLDHLDKYVLVWLAITHNALGQIAEAKRIWNILVAQDQRYRDADWVGKELDWTASLIEAARNLIAEL